MACGNCGKDGIFGNTREVEGVEIPMCSDCAMAHDDDRQEIENATRAELIGYLESWGFQCYDSESTDELRAAALENFDTEN